MDKRKFVSSVFRVAKDRGLNIKEAASGTNQIFFDESGNNYLDTGHLEKLFLKLGSDLPTGELTTYISAIAPRVSCNHRAIREIVEIVAAQD
jgi:hypothetical protein